MQTHVTANGCSIKNTLPIIKAHVDELLANRNINDRLSQVYYRICTDKQIRIEIIHGRILVHVPCILRILVFKHILKCLHLQ